MAEDFRTWNMIGGGYFEAKLTGVGATTITLENKEGRSVDMPLANLKPSDQKYARTWQQAQSPEGQSREWCCDSRAVGFCSARL